MMPSSQLREHQSPPLVRPVRRSFAGLLVLLLLAGCGLAMSPDEQLDRAEAALRDGDVRAAIIDAKDVLLDQPDNRRGRVLLGRASLLAGDSATAEKELKRAVQLGVSVADVAPEMARALLMQGRFQEVLDTIPVDAGTTVDADVTIRTAHGDAYIGLEQPEAARELYRSVLERRADDLPALLGIATSYISERNPLQAEAAINHALEAHADAPRAWLYSAAFHSRQRNSSAAEANYRVALDLADKSNDRAAKLEALSGLANTLYDAGAPDTAATYIDQLVAAAPQAIETRLLVARRAIDAADWSTAQQNLQQILAVDPTYRPAQVLLGTVHMERGNLGQAEMYLSAAVAARPQDAAARRLLAATQLRLQKSEDAQEALAPIVSQPGADLTSLQMAAQASLGRRDFEEALGYLRRSAEQNPDNIDVKFQLAAALIEAGQSDTAQDVLDGIDVSTSRDTAYWRDALGALSALREGRIDAARQAALTLADNHSDRHGAFNLLGAIHLASGDLAVARTSFEKAGELEPDDLVSQRYLAGIDAAEGNVAEAESRFRQIAEQHPNAAWAMAALGKIAYARQDYEAAAAEFRRALAAEPGNTDYRLRLARAERRAGDRTAAAAALGTDVDGNLDDVPTSVMRGILKAESGDIAGALALAKRLQARHPDSAAPFAFEAEVHLIADDLPKADMYYDKALSLGLARNHVLRAYQVKQRLGITGAEQPLMRYLEERPLDGQMRAILAEYYMRSGELGKSIAAYERVVADDPDNGIALNNLAWNYHLAGDQRAVSTARQALAAMPDNGSVADTLGWLLVQRGDVEEGERLLRRALELRSGAADIRYHHAVALSKLGRDDEARQALQEILANGDAFSSRQEAEKLLAEL